MPGFYRSCRAFAFPAAVPQAELLELQPRESLWEASSKPLNLWEAAAAPCRVVDKLSEELCCMARQQRL